MGDQQPVLGAGGGDVEQAALLGEPLGVRRGQRPPRGQQLLLAAEQRDRLGLGALGAVDRRHGDPPVGGGVDLLGVKAGGVLEEAGERRVLVVLLVGLGGAAQRAQVLEHPLGVAAAARGRACGRAGAGSGGPDRRAASPSRSRRGRATVRRRARRGPARAPAPNSTSRIARGLGADAVELAGVGAGGDQVAAVMLARPRDQLA